ncbi:Glycerol-3-phosphate phosphatase [Caenorhabditis elegans]|uniref:Glycerol-3-phosphate phosphatase n=1 Tax=Caenorhabditis elegans TaxID=6239 RepID=A9Z1J6_CAEEL|nr:4-nitrophenylphosphatase [Caenorhabditis elegans]CCD71831.1 4-nitrophenylphosphatase [Caenorhabditis elegans]|eukprot:NP_001122707.1 Putative NipSnap protein K02D10.1 [Caenorhabditis elegans]
MSINRISKNELLANYDTFLFDADGVLWTGDIPVPGAIEWINLLLEDPSKKVFVLTNNSTKTLEQYMKKIEKLGFGHLGRNNVISPAIVLADYLKSNADKFSGEYVYLIGTENLKATLENDGGVKCFGTGPDSIRDHTDGDFIHKVDMSIAPKAVVCSYDAHFSYPKIMKASNYLQDPSVEYLVTNQDYTFPGPVPGVVIPGSGATSAAVTAVTGRDPKVFGKPHKPMADFLLRRAHVDPKRTVMFGDRLDTDIMFGNANGFSSVWMPTGVHTIVDIHNAKEKGQLDRIPTFTHCFATGD